jgi:hypothetical protein
MPGTRQASAVLADIFPAWKCRAISPHVPGAAGEFSPGFVEARALTARMSICNLKIALI